MQYKNNYSFEQVSLISRWLVKKEKLKDVMPVYFGQTCLSYSLTMAYLRSNTYSLKYEKQVDTDTHAC